jgi:hypothetical protein
MFSVGLQFPAIGGLLAASGSTLQAEPGLCYDLFMKANTKETRKRPARGLTLGRAAAAKLNAVEGIVLSHETQGAFAEFDRLGLSFEQRRHRLRKQFGASSG